jgi:predicted ArsR family transcriptional regulator
LSEPHETRPVYLVERPEQLRALASPVRHRVLAGFEALGRCTVRELADHLGTAPESLYYHVKELVRVGLIVDAGKQPTERRLAQLYQLVSRDLEVCIEGAADEYREAYADMGGALLRWADRAHRASLGDDVRQSGESRQRSLMQFHPRLTDEAVAELNRRFAAIEEFLRENEDPTAAPYVVTVVSSPSRYS